MNVSVCRLPFTKPEYYRFKEIYRGGDGIFLISCSDNVDIFEDQPIDFAAFSIASRSPTKTGLTSLNLWARRAVSRTVELVARTKINSFGLSLDAFLIRVSDRWHVHHIKAVFGSFIPFRTIRKFHVAQDFYRYWTMRQVCYSTFCLLTHACHPT